ncbi:UDP-N-acetylmuramoyl-L-alanine--D-glutamate ligase [Thorsellia kenyensis]|uniref:UDP-N-acetylmuramoylalanine--D-glutamate ligase n=1 Tax=Thorsellia kenyensis TaxID=1549888 RepID=A0ABV6CE57_9GAMM
MDYQNKKVVIIGLGLTGLSCLDYFMSKGINPRLIDTRKSPTGLSTIPKEIEVHTGSIKLDWVLDADLLVVSPGVPLATPEIQEAIKKGIEVVGDIELFCREVNNANAQIIAITGSNGKSTVTSLVGQMAISNRIKTAVGGNIGLPVLSFLEDKHDLYVLELSSFQLETTYSLKAKAATILNISEDHLDRYADNIENYITAKHRIYNKAQTTVYFVNDAHTRPKTNESQSLVDFGGTNSPYRIEKIEGEEWLIADNKPLMQCTEVALKGYHNYLNILAALALAKTVGIDPKSCIETLKHFSGLAHRFSVVHEANGITWVNDSKATNVGSVIAALKDFNREGKIHLLMGGDSKSANLTPLIPILKDGKKQIYCFGQDGQKIQSLSPENSVFVETLEEAMQLARKNAVEGDWIILSPACASLDQFKNYEHRGQVFIELANQLS